MMLRDMDINAIAGTLKLYFRELPEPLLTDRLYSTFMQGIGMSKFACNAQGGWAGTEFGGLFILLLRNWQGKVGPPLSAYALRGLYRLITLASAWTALLLFSTFFPPLEIENQDLWVVNPD